MTPGARRPNILVFVSHDTGRFISPYGVRTVHTPSAERLAAQGVLFERCFCTAPQCSPARASLFTGRCPHATGVLGLTGGQHGWDLDDTEVHAAQHFRALGYDTALVGIAHETSTPARRGFDTIRPERNALDAPRAAAAWLDARSSTRPFYLQIGIFETHIPFAHDAAEPDDGHGVTVPAYLPDTEGTRHDLRGFQGSVRRWDQAVGAVLDLLDARGLADNTLLVVTTDHGIPFPRAKCTLFDSGLGVLLLLRWPGGGLSDGQRIPDMVSHLDVLPSLLEAAGAEVPGRLHGISFLPRLQGRAYQPRERVFAQMTFHEHYEPIRGVRTNRHKYIRYFDAGATIDIPSDMRLNRMYTDNVRELVHSPSHRKLEYLYDLEQDPDELCNLAEDPAHQAVRAELSATLADWMRRVDDPLLKGPVPSRWYERCMATLGR